MDSVLVEPKTDVHLKWFSTATADLQTTLPPTHLGTADGSVIQFGMTSTSAAAFVQDFV